MRKATDCVQKAAKAKIPDKKTNLLVYKKDECKVEYKNIKHQNIITPQCETNAKRIRVCTGAEMKKMCAPKVCPCPRKSSVPLGVAGLVKFALKAALAGSIVYLTVQAGVWGKPETSEELYYTFYQMLLPKVCKDDDEDIHRQTFLDRSQHKELCEAYQGLMEYPIPHKKEEECTTPCPQTNEKLTFLIQSKWNRFITCAFTCGLALPSMISRKLSGEPEPEEVIIEIDECED